MMKVMVLLLFAIFHDADKPIDAAAFVGPVDRAACEAHADVLGQEWKAQDPTVEAVIGNCFETDDPKEFLNEYRKAHPPAPPPHVPGKDEA